MKKILKILSISLLVMDVIIIVGGYMHRFTPKSLDTI
ncbi:Uncharacterised protein [Staphylococcus pseudintermedius]|nr:Uncharacterised protein [Staphylococcus pseudintermedius]VTS56887.1 Uncharacterised protein [Staphylococcus pseudintermedius]